MLTSVDAMNIEPEIESVTTWDFLGTEFTNPCVMQRIAI